ncbi:hypothetical protein [Bradyrhizobium sp. CCBAU 25338]|uniref:hypothetical protein n=1 Tax=Bradyrhizobium sp. CCBAU 25338 TaxID=1641877 RepID=UPI00230338EC|nr:hypothetical protein [Bradyrhizobium sp. CCBAU 25338]
MSWILVDGITEEVLYDCLDLAPTGGTPDRYDLGTSYVPLAGAVLKSGWCGVFAKYALVMDATVGKSPIPLTRLPAKSRCITCVVLEHAMVSYASLWQGGHSAWEIRHDSGQGRSHLEARGDPPVVFKELCDTAMKKQRAEDAQGKPGEWGVDYVFDVPINTAASIAGYRHDRVVEEDFFKALRTLAPANGNVLTKLNQPPGWWQTVGSTNYE